MSTCRGAMWPHTNCPHGSQCDWEGYGLTMAEWQRLPRTTELDRELIALEQKNAAPWPFARG